MDSGDFTSSVVVVDLTNQAYSESSSVTTHSSAVKRLDCNTKRLHMFTSDKWALKVLHYRLFPPHTIRHLPIRPSCSTWEFFFFILLVAAFFLHVIFFPYPHISNLFVIFFFKRSTTCPAAVWLHLTLLSHYRCDLNPFTASTLPSTDGHCCAADWCQNKKETSFLPLQVCFSIYL